MQVVAGIDLPDAGLAGNRRGDRRVVQLSLGAVDRRLVALDLGAELGHQCALRIERLLAGEILRCQRDIAVEVALRIGQLRFVLGLGRDRLIVGRLVGAGIDLGQEIALLHHLPFGEVDLHQLAVDARRDRHRIERLHRAEAAQIDRHVGSRGNGRVDRDRCRGAGRCGGRVPSVQAAGQDDGDERGAAGAEKHQAGPAETGQFLFGFGLHGVFASACCQPPPSALNSETKACRRRKRA